MPSPRMAFLTGVAAAAIALGAVEPAAVRAAAPEVEIVSATTYSVHPEDNRVHVQVDATLTSRVADTASVSYYVNEAFFGLLPGAMNVAASSHGKPLRASVTDATDDYLAIGIRLGANVFSGQSYQFRLDYDLLGLPDAAAPYTRVDESFVSFPAWSHGTPDAAGSSVRVVLPAGYELGFTVGDLPPPVRTESGETVLDFGVVPAGDEFFALITASRISALHQVVAITDVNGRPVRVVLRGWADDPNWAERVGRVVREGLPVLADLVGIPYAGSDTLYVDETVSWLIGGYAGQYDAATGTARVTETADDFVTLHETAHVWLNESTVTARWIGEGFADWYAMQAAERMGIEIGSHDPSQPEEYRFALDGWAPAGDADETDEDYGYAAARFAAAEIAERAGSDGLRLVWLAVDNNETAYQPLHAERPERSGVGPVDSRRLLDLLEERTGTDYGDIWLRWVTIDGATIEMARRDTAREAYSALGGRAGAWELPVGLRRALEAWDFALANTEMDAANQVLDDRDAIVAQAGQLLVTPPDDLRAAFEAGDWSVARVLARDERTAVEALGRAESAVDADVDPVESVGLIGEELEVHLSAALAAYETAAVAEATLTAQEIVITHDAARQTGEQRLALGGSAVAVLLSWAVSWWSTRRGGRAALVQSSKASVADTSLAPPPRVSRPRQPKRTSNKPEEPGPRRSPVKRAKHESAPRRSSPRTASQNETDPPRATRSTMAAVARAPAER